MGVDYTIATNTKMSKQKEIITETKHKQNIIDTLSSATPPLYPTLTSSDLLNDLQSESRVKMNDQSSQDDHPPRLQLLRHLRSFILHNDRSRRGDSSLLQFRFVLLIIVGRKFGVGIAVHIQFMYAMSESFNRR